MREWMRPKEIASTYGIGRTRVYELVSQFRQEADPKYFIKDGGVLIVQREAFEEWWRNRSA